MLFTVFNGDTLNEFYKKNDYIYLKKDNLMVPITKIFVEKKVIGGEILTRSFGSKYVTTTPRLTQVPSSLGATSVAGALAGIFNAPVSLFVVVADLIIGDLKGPDYVYTSYDWNNYSTCSVLEKRLNFRTYKAVYNGTNWSRGTLVNNISSASYYWTSDPANFTNPASCRTAAKTFPYPKGTIN